MGTFDEAKKLFPPVKHDHGQEKPKDKPQPLGLGRAMQFNGVVGRSTIPIATTVTNPNHQRVKLDVKTSGTDFRATSFAEEVNELQSGDNTATASVQYVPTRPGTMRGLLHIISRFDEEGESGPAVEQQLELTGTATELAHPTPAPGDGSPRPVPDLDAEDKHLAPRQQIENDLDALSGLAETYTKIVGGNDDASTEMIRRIYHAKSEFDAQIRQWVQAELVTNTVSEASSAAKLGWKAISKVVGAGLEKLEMGSVVGLVVGQVADLAFDRLEEYVGADPQAKSKEAAKASASEGGSELIAKTDELVKRRLSGLTTRLATTRAEAAQIAGSVAMYREGQAQEALASNQPYRPGSTSSLIHQFSDALDRYSDTCRAIAAASTQIKPSLTTSFNELRMRYLKERASKSSDLTYRVEYAVAWDLGSDESNGRETFRAFEPKISGIDRTSEPMREFIAHRKLSDYAADADLAVRVNCKQGGYVIIEKRVGEEPTFKDVQGIGAVRAAMRGARNFWGQLEEQIG